MNMQGLGSTNPITTVFSLPLYLPFCGCQAGAKRPGGADTTPKSSGKKPRADTPAVKKGAGERMGAGVGGWAGGWVPLGGTGWGYECNTFCCAVVTPW